jgi:hypothetical protein
MLFISQKYIVGDWKGRSRFSVFGFHLYSLYVSLGYFSTVSLELWLE